MTWAEFKRQVEDAGVKDNYEVKWIDASPHDKIEVEIICKLQLGRGSLAEVPSFKVWSY